jgi:hypothetical protein
LKVAVIYLIGSLRNPIIPEVGNELRKLGHEIFEDWFAAGPRADDHWQEYEKGRGRTYAEAMKGRAVANVVSFDLFNLRRSDIAVLIMPAGKSGHTEMGFMIGAGKKVYVLFDGEPERWDAMYGLVPETGGELCFSLDELKAALGPAAGVAATKVLPLAVAPAIAPGTGAD